MRPLRSTLRAVSLIALGAFGAGALIVAPILRSEAAGDIAFVGRPAPDPLFVLNQRINRLSTADRHADGRAADGAWDCEDYAFAKRDALRAEGVYSEVWRVKDSRDTAHATVRIPKAPGVYSPRDPVMDNRFHGLTTVHDAEQFQRYVFVRPMVSPTDEGLAVETPPAEASPEYWGLYWRAVFAAQDAREQQLVADTGAR